MNKLKLVLYKMLLNTTHHNCKAGLQLVNSKNYHCSSLLMTIVQVDVRCRFIDYSKNYHYSSLLMTIVQVDVRCRFFYCARHYARVFGLYNNKYITKHPSFSECLLHRQQFAGVSNESSDKFSDSIQNKLLY